MHSSNLNIKKAGEEDIKEISLLHLKSFDENHFTSGFSMEYMVKYYSLILKYNEYCYVLRDGHQLIGFLIAGYKTNTAIKEFIKNNKFYLLRALMKRPEFIVQKIRIFIQTNFRHNQKFKEKFRVLSLAVDADSGLKGIGTMLLEFLENELIKNKIFTYGLSVRRVNTKAINFYRKNNFEIEQEYTDTLYYKKILIHK